MELFGIVWHEWAAIVALLAVSVFSLWQHRRLSSKAASSGPAVSPHVECSGVLGDFAGSLAHELNNLLVPIVCNAELIATMHQGDEKTQSRLQALLNATTSTNNICQRMLSWSGRQSSGKVLLDLNTVAKSAIAEISEDGMAVEFSQANLAIQLPVDAAQIKSAIVELIRNASESLSDNAGLIALSVSRTKLIAADDDSLVLATVGATEPVGDFASIEVSDSGCGFADSDIEQLFRPLCSNHEGRCRGLGLPIVLSHVARHGGLVQILRKAEFGSSVRILLPLK